MPTLQSRDSEIAPTKDVQGKGHFTSSVGGDKRDRDGSLGHP